MYMILKYPKGDLPSYKLLNYLRESTIFIRNLRIHMKRVFTYSTLRESSKCSISISINPYFVEKVQKMYPSMLRHRYYINIIMLALIRDVSRGSDLKINLSSNKCPLIDSIYSLELEKGIFNLDVNYELLNSVISNLTRGCYYDSDWFTKSFIMLHTKGL